MSSLKTLLHKFVFVIKEKGKALPPLEENTIDGLSSESQGSDAGVWIGVGAGVILVLFVIIALFYLKMYFNCHLFIVICTNNLK